MTESVPHRYRNDRGKLTIGWRFVAGLSFGVLLATVVSLFRIFPYKPETWIGWCLVVVCVPVIEILSEMVWDIWLRFGKRFVPAESMEKFSPIRILVALIGLLLMIGIGYTILLFVGTPIAAFLAPHFSTW
jgi:hypothetical protein